MPVHNFDFSLDANPNLLVNHQFTPKDDVDRIERVPQIAPLPIMDKAEPLTRMMFDPQNTNFTTEVREILPQGFRTMDRGIKNYFSGIRVPTKDGLRIMQVRICGGDKPYQIWAQDLVRGRITLPVMSIKRESQEFFKEKFSTPHQHWFRRRFADPECSRIILTPRPVPTKATYNLSIWAEHKRDLEFIQYQVLTRFNPIAEFLVEDEYLRMALVLHYNSMTNSGDDETPADQRANKRYDFSVTMEGYLPLPPRVVPSILGRVTTLRDGGETLFGQILQEIAGPLVVDTKI